MDKDKLIAAGIDYDQGVGRFVGRADLYESFLEQFFQDTTMKTLQVQLEQEDYPAAFETAHDLKGVTGNLSINRLYRTLCVIVEGLRTDPEQIDLNALYQQAAQEHAMAMEAVMH